MNEIIFNIVQNIAKLMAEHRFADIIELTKGIRLNVEQISGEIREYGRTLLPLPNDAFKYVSIVEVRNSPMQKWSVSSPLWTKEEGRSDLSIELTIFTNDRINFMVELDSIHVL